MTQNNTTLELSILNRHAPTIPGPVLLHELVQASSNSPAVDFLENGSARRMYAYTTLHMLSDKLARAILEVSTQVENSSPIIPVLLPQCPELYIALLAVLKAGKSFCPLGLDTPSERLNFILQDISADVLISTSTLSTQITLTKDVRYMLVDCLLTEQNQQPGIDLPCVNPTDLAYVLYTSGSTGLPKAVSMSHRAVTQSLLAHDRHIPEFSRFLQFAAPTFDVSIFEIFFTWFRGRTLVGCTRAQMLDDLPGCIQDLEVDAAELTPTVVSNLLSDRSSVPGLKLLLTIGEMLNQHIIDEYGGDDSRESMLWAMYGPTEAAIHCTLQPQLSKSSPIGNIGFPLETVSVLVVAPATDANASNDIEILPKGEIGELVVAGPQIAEEYLNRPELTTTAFVNHPEFGRLYRTGDLGRVCVDEKLEILGRAVAGQVKLRGQRIELGEIETTVLKVDGCRAAAAVVIKDNLIVFCGTGSCHVSRTDVLRTCEQWLPELMVPSDVCIMASMPQLSSGKVDKTALKSKYLQESQANGLLLLEHEDYTTNPVLRMFGQITKKRIHLDSDLASVGLDSLQSIRLASMLRQEGYKLSAVDILKAKGLRDLMNICRSSRLTNGIHGSLNLPDDFFAGPTVPELDRCRADVACMIPCTPLQEAMLAKTIARPSAYCNWIEFELPGSCTYNKIRDILSTLIEANEILRSGFFCKSSHAATFVQIIWKSFKGSQIQGVGSFSRCYSLGSDESMLRPLNIQVKIGPGSSRVLFQIHHALYDGWSVDLLLHDFETLLRGNEIGPRPQFKDVVNYYTTQTSLPENEIHRKYWADLLHDHDPMSLPNYNGKIVDSQGIRMVSRRSAINIATLSRCAAELMVHPQVFFQAATAYVLSLYTGSTDVVIGNVTSGRTLPVTRVEDIFGPCIASLPFRLDFQHLSKVRDVLSKTQALNRESLLHCSLPLREIAKAAHAQPGSQLFEVLFVWQQSLISSDSLSDIKIVDSADDSEYKITVEYEPRNDCIVSRITFDASTVPEKQVKYLSEQIDEVVTLFLQDSTTTVADISRCFTNSLRSVANPTPFQTHFSNGPAKAVEKWASNFPDKDAISFAHIVDGSIQIKDTITYDNLNRQANQLARVLLEHGANNHQLIGLVMEKSIEMYVAILAIAKVGSGYLPLVPDTPLERIQGIFNDSQISVCVSESAFSEKCRQSLSIHFLDFDLMSFSNYSSLNLDIHYDGSRLAYAVFTSGSTGTPKGVLVTQDNLMHNLDYLSSAYPYTASSKMLQASSQAFDVSVFEIFFSWHVGICLCAARKDDLFRDLEHTINSLEVTHLSLTPTVAALIEPEKVPKVQFLVTAGEALTERVRRKWAGRGLYQGN